MFRVVLVLALIPVIGVTAMEKQKTAESGVFSVRCFGALGDGINKDTAAIQRAIDACHAGGGGTVLFPAGTYLSGTIRLKDNVVLHLEPGAVLKGSPDDGDYDPYEELGFPNDADKETSFFHFALIQGVGVSHVGIEGRGTIDGNREKRGGPKPIALKRCYDVMIRDIRIINAPNYNISLLGTDNVLIDGVTILNGFSDGIDPDSCRNVRIANCHVESVDDAIVLKSSFSLGERRPCENITITNCYLATLHNAFKCGTESGGDFKRIAVSNCVMDMLTGGHRPATSGVALESVDGAVMEDVVISNLTMVNVRCPIFVRLGNRGRDMETPVPGAVRRISVSNVTATGASLPVLLAGIPDHPVSEVTLSSIRIHFAGGTALCTPEEEVPEQIDKYPDPRMFGALPSYALYARHVKGLSVHQFYAGFSDAFWRLSKKEQGVTWKSPEMVPEPAEPGNAGYAAFFDDVCNLSLTSFQAMPALEGTPLIRFVDVCDALVANTVAPEGTRVFLELAGKQTRGVCLSGNDLTRAEKTIQRHVDVPRSTLVSPR
ncbi:MAG TPA: glycoside hydrolase family 28 protein [Candidatus Hydrogenedentes bacterium]|nr:glycoside hydrolase family 28 protein [Candidatus Hydrogenedentota bacterium]HOL76188.1 glycoside hydrolase family 28 protein [Candidatus Hydrogenedentota bacterium]HPO85999.1 glycoside hydrolase family 28 protein [Candidatus Hydrogenedentota bacterium]